MHPDPDPNLAGVLMAVVVFAALSAGFALAGSLKASPRHNSSGWWTVSRIANVILTSMLAGAAYATCTTPLHPSSAIQFEKLWWLTTTLAGLVALINVAGLTRFVKQNDLITVSCLVSAISVIILLVASMSNTILTPVETALVAIIVFLAGTSVYLSHLKTKA